MFSKNRAYFVLFLSMAVFGVIFVRVFFLQVFPTKEVESMAKRQYRKLVRVKGKRGEIVDRHGNVLALSVKTISIYADPQLKSKRQKLSAKELRTIGISRKEFNKKIARSKKRRFVWLNRNIDLNTTAAVKELTEKYKWLGTIPTYKRVYLHKHLMAQTIGFTSIDGLGLAGVERQFDSLLKGKETTVRLFRDGINRTVYQNISELRRSWVPGADVELTLDLKLQYRIAQILETYRKKFRSKSAMALVYNVVNGEIYGLSNRPSFDPSMAAYYPVSLRRNRIVSDSIEPGSLIKPFVVAAGLESKKIKFNDVFPYNKEIRVGRHVINDPKDLKKKEITLTDSLKYSSNTAMVEISKKIGFKKLMFFYRDLGLMKRTKVSLPAESSGIFREPNVGDKISPLTMSFGQGFAVTPIQLAYGLAALVNGGKTVEPQIVRQIRTRYFGEFGRNEKKSEVQNILKESNSRRLRHMLSEVVSEEGSGKLAALDHVLKAMGKTGTSQRFNRERKSYVGGGYWSSFWGAFPKENPQIGVLVIFETDSKGEYYGGKVAAPAFKEIAEAALRFIGLELNLSPALKSLSLVE